MKILSSSTTPPAASSADEIKTMRETVRTLQKQIQQLRENWQADVEQRLAQSGDELKKRADAAADEAMKAIQELSRRAQSSTPAPVDSEKMANEIKAIIGKELKDLEAKIAQELEARAPAPVPVPVSVPKEPEPVAVLPKPEEPEPTSAVPLTAPEPISLPDFSKAQEARRPSILVRLWRYLNEPAIQIDR